MINFHITWRQFETRWTGKVISRDATEYKTVTVPVLLYQTVVVVGIGGCAKMFFKNKYSARLSDHKKTKNIATKRGVFVAIIVVIIRYA